MNNNGLFESFLGVLFVVGMCFALWPFILIYFLVYALVTGSNWLWHKLLKIKSEFIGSYLTEKVDLRHSTIQQLNKELLSIDYNYYTNLYIKNNPDWKTSLNTENNIEKLAEAISYKHLVKILKDEGFDSTKKGDINKFSEKLILEEEQDYDDIIQLVIKRVNSELTKIKESPYNMT